MNKGFTLIELLAVIVILAIILVISVPQINKVIEDSKISSMESSAILVAKNIENTIALNEDRPNTIDCLDSAYGIKSTEYTSCIASIKYNDNITVEVALIGTGKYDKLVANGTSTKATTDRLDANSKLLNETLIQTVNGKDIDVNKYAGNGLYKWGDKYIYRGGITKTNPSGTLANNQYTTDVDSGNEVNNYIKVPWETYTVGEDCISTTNKCYRIISVNADGSTTIVRDKILVNQRFDETINTAARINYGTSNIYGYNDLLGNIPTEGHPEEYREYSLMYTYLYGTSGYQNTVIKPYSKILQPLDVCLNKVNNYAALNINNYATTTRVTDTCNVSGKPNTLTILPLKNQYVRFPYSEEYLNATLDSTCTTDSQYQCRNQNYMYQKQTYWSLNGYFSASWHVRSVSILGSADNYYAFSSVAVRPVVNLKSITLIIGGTGTQASPYIVKWE